MEKSTFFLSPLDKGANFNEKSLVYNIKSFSKPTRKRYDGYTGENFPIVTLFNSWAGNSQRTETQISNQKLETLLKKILPHRRSNARILPHSSQIRDYAKVLPTEDVNQKLLDIFKEILHSSMERNLIPMN